MAYVTPTNRSTGDLITTAIWNQDVVANMKVIDPTVGAVAGQILKVNSGLDGYDFGNISTLQEGPLPGMHPFSFTDTTLQLNNNVQMRVGLISIPYRITVTEVSFAVTAVGTSGTLGLALFSNDGQTRYINETTGTISGTSAKYTVTLGTPVTLEPGLYYIGFNPDSTADITVRSWAAGPSPLNQAASAGLNEPAGYVTVTASTIPTTFDPDADISANSQACVIVRFN